MSEWKLIETAPKDGTRVLVYGEEVVMALVWDVYYPSHKAQQGTEEFGWVTFPGQIGVDMSEVSHWQPLPEPPSQPLHTES